LYPRYAWKLKILTDGEAKKKFEKKKKHSRNKVLHEANFGRNFIICARAKIPQKVVVFLFLNESTAVSKACHSRSIIIENTQIKKCFPSFRLKVFVAARQVKPTSSRIFYDFTKKSLAVFFNNFGQKYKRAEVRRGGASTACFISSL